MGNSFGMLPECISIASIRLLFVNSEIGAAYLLIGERSVLHSQESRDM